MWNILREGDLEKATALLNKTNTKYQIVFEPLEDTSSPAYHAYFVVEGQSDRVIVTILDLKPKTYSNLNRGIERIKQVCPNLKHIHVRTKPNEVRNAPKETTA